MRWTELRIRAADDAQRGAVVAALIAAGAGGVQELDDDLLTHLPAATDFAALERAVRTADAGARIEQRDLGEVDWSRQWTPRIGVQRIGRVAVAPPWRADEIADAPAPVIIDPAMAFGTGEHETTRGVLHLMQRVVQPGDVVADLGAGSAILSIAAARLGARRVAAIEIDRDAIENAEANVRANGVSDRVTVIEGDATVLLPLVAPVGLILANILAPVVIDLLTPMRAALGSGGRAIVSGILVAERDDVCGALAAGAWVVHTEHVEGDWWSSVVAPR